MKILMHICCGPCTIYPLKELRTHGFDVSGVFYNPNIHPYREYLKRLQTLNDYAGKAFLNIFYPEGYPLEDFLRQILLQENDRCEYCLQHRLQYAAEMALADKYDAFTTTLLYSKFQKHDLIREIGEHFGRQVGVPFYYQDFRAGWDEGVKISRELEMYRQPYCGCIFSEKERFYK